MAPFYLDAQAPFRLIAAGNEYSLICFELVEPSKALRLCATASFADRPLVPPPAIHSTTHTELQLVLGTAAVSRNPTYLLPSGVVRRGLKLPIEKT